MTSATLPIGQERPSAAEILEFGSEQASLPERPGISPAAWRVAIYLLVGSAVFLAAVGAYVLSGMYRFQNCL